MNVITLRDAVASVPLLSADTQTSTDAAIAAVRFLGDFNTCAVGLARFSGHTPWERHPDDELLHVLAGTVEVEILPAEGAAHRATLGVGELLVVPATLWHRQVARDEVTLLFVTSRDDNAVSTADDPRTAASPTPA